MGDKWLDDLFALMDEVYDPTSRPEEDWRVPPMTDASSSWGNYSSAPYSSTPITWESRPTLDFLTEGERDPPYVPGGVVYQSPSSSLRQGRGPIQSFPSNPPPSPTPAPREGPIAWQAELASDAQRAAVLPTNRSSGVWPTAPPNAALQPTLEQAAQEVAQSGSNQLGPNPGALMIARLRRMRRGQ